jgi:hypothetical protein
MIEADSVHSTPPVSSSSLKAFSDREARVCDPDRPSEIALGRREIVFCGSNFRCKAGIYLSITCKPASAGKGPS